MDNYHSILLTNAVHQVSTLPGIGEKTALRLVLNLLKRPEKEIDTFRKWWFVIPLLSIYTMLVIFCENTDPLISTLNIQPLGFLTSAMGCLLFVWLCKCLPEMKHLTFIGQNSLGFYFLSGALPITLSLVAHKMIAGTSFWLLLMIWAVCMVIAYVSVQIINRWLPWLWDLRKLNKA